MGVYEEKPADYPDLALKVAANWWPPGTAARGIVIDGAGIGSSMAANKVPGIRAALCYDKASARNSREHNDSNVLTLGARLLTETQAEDVLRTWMATPFAGGRHQARVREDPGNRAAYLQEGILVTQTELDLLVAQIGEEFWRAWAPAPRRQEGRRAQPARPGVPRLRAALRPDLRPQHQGDYRRRRRRAFPPASGSPRSIRPSPRSSITPFSSPKPPAPTSSRSAAKRANTSFASVCVNPYWVPLVRAELAGSPVKVCTVVGFPLGATSTEAKVAETAAAVRAGAQEIDMVINVGALRSGDQ